MKPAHFLWLTIPLVFVWIVVRSSWASYSWGFFCLWVIGLGALVCGGMCVRVFAGRATAMAKWKRNLVALALFLAGGAAYLFVSYVGCSQNFFGL